MKKAVLLFFKAAVSSALLMYLLSKVGGTAVIENAILLSPLHFGAAVALYLLATYLSSVRWKLLIPQPVGTKRLFSMYIVGSFFNVCLPGLIGGDAVKAYYLSRELKQSSSNEDTEYPRHRLDSDSFRIHGPVHRPGSVTVHKLDSIPSRV